MSSSVYNHPSTIDDIAYSQPGNNYVNSSGNESSEGKASTTTSMTEHDEVKNEDGYRVRARVALGNALNAPGTSRPSTT